MQTQNYKDKLPKIKESSLQISCVEYFQRIYPKLSPYLIHIPNGGKRNLLEALKFKKMGVKPGVFDLLFMVPTKQHVGLWIELKVGNNSLTENQKNFQKLAESSGYKTVVIKTIEEFLSEISKYLLNK